MFLDDIGKAVGDVVGDVASAAPKLDLASLGKDVFGAVSSAEMRLISGVAHSASTVADVFGGLELFDSQCPNPVSAVQRDLIQLAQDLNPQSGNAVTMGNPFTEFAEELSRQSGHSDRQGNPLLDLFDQLNGSQEPRGAAPGEGVMFPGSVADALKQAQASQSGNFGRISDGIGAALHFQNADELNPQPLPPGPAERFSQIASELNPQPLPPGPSERFSQIASELNPQPLPPGPSERFSRIASELNPQPLPPGPPDLFSRIAINPQPLPPGPERVIANLGSIKSKLRGL